MLRSDAALRGLTLLTLLLAPSLGAQERDVLSKQLAVGRSEASLELELEDSGSLEISLRDGTLWIDGEAVGAYEAGDALDAAFRSLLASAVALENGPLAEMLRDWAPPEELAGESRALATRIDRALEEALTEPAAAAREEPEVVSITFGSGDAESLVGLLLGRLGQLGMLEGALADLEDVELHIEEDVVVEADRTVEGALVVIQGNARVDGRVTEDVVVVGGRLELGPEAEIGGDVRIADGRLENAGASIGGTVRDLLDEEPSARPDVRDLRERIRAEIRDEVRNEIRDEIRSEIRQTSRGRGDSFVMAPFRGVLGAVGGLFENFVAILLLGLAGMGFLAFAGPNLDAVTETARRAPGRAAMVGVAGSFLLIPVWVLGAVALAVSIIGIPVLVAWVPLFPLAAVAAAAMGYVAVARNAGEWLADSGYRYTDWIRGSNAVTTIVGGLVGLMGFFILANVLRAVPFVGALRGLLTFAGVVVTLVAVMIGFGAVLLTRAGRRPEYYPLDPEEAWRRAVDVDIEVEVADVETEARAGTARETATDVEVEVEEAEADGPSAEAAPEEREAKDDGDGKKKGEGGDHA